MLKDGKCQGRSPEAPLGNRGAMARKENGSK